MRTLYLRPLFPGLGIACLWLNTLATQLHAQEASAPDYATALTKTVHLTLGKTTIADALAALSNQTGIKIDALEYLKDREMVVQIDGLSGRAALDAITTLNDLRWSVAGPGHLIVSRPTPHSPAKITEVPDLLAQALPKDVRSFLLIGMPQNMGWEFAKRGDFQRRTDSTYRDLLHSRSGNVVLQQTTQFLAGLPNNLPVGTKIPYGKLTPAQQTALVSLLFFKEIGRLPQGIMYNQLAPYQKDVQQASLHFHAVDNILEIGTVTHEGDVETYQFFGAPIAPPPPPKEQLDKKP